MRCTYVCLGVLEIYQCVSSAAVNSAMGRKPRNSLKNACSDLLVGSYLEVIGIFTRLLQSSLFIKFSLEHLVVSCFFWGGGGGGSEMCSKKCFGICQRYVNSIGFDLL
jgi:hypothetical protein